MEYRVNTEEIESIISKYEQKYAELLEISLGLQVLNNELDKYWDAESQMEFESRFGNMIQDIKKSSKPVHAVIQFLSEFVRARLDLEEQARNAAAGNDIPSKIA
jgi:uncharacterized protein YukE